MAAELDLPTDLTTIDIFRQTTEGTNRYDRLCINPASTSQVAYYYEVTPEQVAIHLGDKDGPVIATAPSLDSGDSITEIRVPQYDVKIPIGQGSALFIVNGKGYVWKKRQLIEEQTGRVLALFHPLAGSAHVGNIYITPAGEAMRDLAVIIALVEQGRSEHTKKTKVNHLRDFR